MNKRIEELAIKARQEFLKLPTGYVSTFDGKISEIRLLKLPTRYTPEQVGMYPQLMEKFAELIVEECMWKIMNRKEEAIDNDWDVDEAMSAAISDISEHFGVEQ